MDAPQARAEALTAVDAAIMKVEHTLSLHEHNNWSTAALEDTLRHLRAARALLIAHVVGNWIY